MVKETRKRWLRKESLFYMLCPSLAAPLSGMLVVSWHWLAGRYKPPTRFPFLGLPSVITKHCETAEQDSSLASRRECHSFTQAHCRVSKVRQKNAYTEKAERLELWVFLPCPEDPRWGPKMIAYGEQCKICDRWRRFSFGTRDQAWSLKSFCIAEFY